MSEPQPAAKPTPDSPGAPSGFDPAAGGAELDDSRFSATQAQAFSSEDQQRAVDGRPADRSAQQKYTDSYRSGIGVSGGQVGAVVNGPQYNYYGQSGVGTRQVIADQITGSEAGALRAVFVPPSSFDQALQLLEARHVVVLHGATGSGKTSLALGMLLTRYVIVQQIDPSVEADQLTGHAFGPAQGYLIDTLAPAVAVKLTRFTLSTLANALQRVGSRLVIIVGAEAGLDQKPDVHEYLHTWQDRPVAAAVLRRHIGQLLGTQDTARLEAQKLITHPDVRAFLQRSPSLRDIVKLAGLLCAVADPERKLQIDWALQQLSLFTYQSVADWFRRPGRSLEERSLMITLGVFAGARQELVRQADAALQQELRPPAPREAPAVSDPFANAHDHLRAICAHIERRVEQMNVGATEVSVIVFDNPSMQLAVLEYIWQTFHQLQEPLLRWLYLMGTSDVVDLRGYAASATGWLGRFDLDIVCNYCIERWAQDERWEVRDSAALALGVLAEDDSRAANVLSLLRQWSKGSMPVEYKLTAAAAYGSLVGGRYPNIALERLAMMTATKRVHRELLRQVIRSTYELFAQHQTNVDHGRKVLEALQIWTERPGLPWAIFAGLMSFIWIARYAQIVPMPGAGPVPTLLWMGLAAENGEVRKRVLLLVHRAIHDSRTHQDILRVALRRWLSRVHKADDAQVFDLFARMLNALAQTSPEDKEIVLSWLNDRLEDMPNCRSTIRRLYETIQP